MKIERLRALLGEGNPEERAEKIIEKLSEASRIPIPRQKARVEISKGKLNQANAGLTQAQMNMSIQGPSLKNLVDLKKADANAQIAKAKVMKNKNFVDETTNKKKNFDPISGLPNTPQGGRPRMAKLEENELKVDDAISPASSGVTVLKFGASSEGDKENLEPTVKAPDPEKDPEFDGESDSDLVDGSVKVDALQAETQTKVNVNNNSIEIEVPVKKEGSDMKKEQVLNTISESMNEIFKILKEEGEVVETMEVQPEESSSEETVEVQPEVAETQTEVSVTADSIKIEIPLGSGETAVDEITPEAQEAINEALKVVYSVLGSRSLKENEGETVEVPADAQAEVKVEEDKIVIEIPTTEQPKDEITPEENESLLEALEVISIVLKEAKKTKTVTKAGPKAISPSTKIERKDAVPGKTAIDLKPAKIQESADAPISGEGVTKAEAEAVKPVEVIDNTGSIVKVQSEDHTKVVDGVVKIQDHDHASKEGAEVRDAIHIQETHHKDENEPRTAEEIAKGTHPIHPEVKDGKVTVQSHDLADKEGVEVRGEVIQEEETVEVPTQPQVETEVKDDKIEVEVKTVEGEETEKTVEVAQDVKAEVEVTPDTIKIEIPTTLTDLKVEGEKMEDLKEAFKLIYGIASSKSLNEQKTRLIVPTNIEADISLSEGKYIITLPLNESKGSFSKEERLILQETINIVNHILTENEYAYDLNSRARNAAIAGSLGTVGATGAGGYYLARDAQEKARQALALYADNLKNYQMQRTGLINRYNELYPTTPPAVPTTPNPPIVAEPFIPTPPDIPFEGPITGGPNTNILARRPDIKVLPNDPIGPIGPDGEIIPGSGGGIPSLEDFLASNGLGQAPANPGAVPGFLDALKRGVTGAAEGAGNALNTGLDAVKNFDYSTVLPAVTQFLGSGLGLAAMGGTAALAGGGLIALLGTKSGREWLQRKYGLTKAGKYFKQAEGIRQQAYEQSKLDHLSKAGELRGAFINSKAAADVKARQSRLSLGNQILSKLGGLSNLNVLGWKPFQDKGIQNKLAAQRDLTLKKYQEGGEGLRALDRAGYTYDPKTNAVTKKSDKSLDLARTMAVRDEIEDSSDYSRFLNKLSTDAAKADTVRDNEIGAAQAKYQADMTPIEIEREQKKLAANDEVLKNIQFQNAQALAMNEGFRFNPETVLSLLEGTSFNEEEKIKIASDVFAFSFFNNFKRNLQESGYAVNKTGISKFFADKKISLTEAQTIDLVSSMGYVDFRNGQPFVSETDIVQNKIDNSERMKGNVHGEEVKEIINESELPKPTDAVENQYDIDAANKVGMNPTRKEEQTELTSDKTVLKPEPTDVTTKETTAPGKETEYQSLKEAFLLEDDYFDKDSVSVLSPSQKQDKLVNQIGLLIARDSQDPLFEELLHSTAVTRELQAELQEKYKGLAKKKAAQLLEAKRQKKLKKSKPEETQASLINTPMMESSDLNEGLLSWIKGKLLMMIVGLLDEGTLDSLIMKAHTKAMSKATNAEQRKIVQERFTKTFVDKAAKAEFIKMLIKKAPEDEFKRADEKLKSIANSVSKSPVKQQAPALSEDVGTGLSLAGIAAQILGSGPISLVVGILSGLVISGAVALVGGMIERSVDNYNNPYRD
jgi:hypothetical protein